MGTIIFWGAIVVGGILGIILISLASMAQKAEEFYDHMPCGDGKCLEADTYSVPAAETLSPTSRGEVRPQRALSESVVAP
jgi:hypothetical protein